MPQPTSPPAHKPDMPAISLPQLTSAVRLFDDADCRRHIHKCAPRKDCQVCVASHPAWALSRPLAQETGKHDQVTRTTMSALHDKALARSRPRIFSFASFAWGKGCLLRDASQTALKHLPSCHACVAYVCCLSHLLPLTHAAPSHHKLNPQSVKSPET